MDDYPSHPTHCSMRQIQVKGPKVWTPEINTQRYNMDAALGYVTGDVIFIIEDDEYYAPEYLLSMINLLSSGAKLAGISTAKYYHLKAPGYKIIDNFRHASLCQTVMLKSMLPLLYQAVHSGEYYFDIHLWKNAQKIGIPCALISNTDLSISTKGLPGRAGLGAGHEIVGYQGDRGLTMLKTWIKDDYKYYENLIRK